MDGSASVTVKNPSINGSVLATSFELDDLTIVHIITTLNEDKIVDMNFEPDHR